MNIFFNIVITLNVCQAINEITIWPCNLILDEHKHIEIGHKALYIYKRKKLSTWTSFFSDQITIESFEEEQHLHDDHIPEC